MAMSASFIKVLPVTTLPVTSYMVSTNVYYSIHTSKNTSYTFTYTYQRINEWRHLTHSKPLILKITKDHQEIYKQ